MRESDFALMIWDCDQMTRVKSAGAFIKPWLHCGSGGVAVLHSVRSEADMFFVRCYEEVEHKRALSDLT